MKHFLSIHDQLEIFLPCGFLTTVYLLHSIGLIYKKTERYAKAADCLKRSLILKTKHYIGGHHSVADTMNHLAQVYTELKRFKEATPLFEKALSIFEKKFGAHMTTAETLDSLGKVEFFQGRNFT